MTDDLSQRINTVENTEERDKLAFVAEIVGDVQLAEYKIVEIDDLKPWGAYIRIDSSQAGRFIEEFFPGLTIEDARLGMEEAELSPKLLIISPDQRLSWQYHLRRAGRWAFLTSGIYYKSVTDEQGDPIAATVGDVVQFKKGERHRLASLPGSYTIVAEIWQHADSNNPSNEEDIVRLSDDYQR